MKTLLGTIGVALLLSVPSLAAEVRYWQGVLDIGFDLSIKEHMPCFVAVQRVGEGVYNFLSWECEDPAYSSTFSRIVYQKIEKIPDGTTSAHLEPAEGGEMKIVFDK